MTDETGLNSPERENLIDNHKLTDIDRRKMLDEISKPEYYNNRELSWLAFNERVLEEAEDETNPLLERLRFIAIFS